jgi:hypothetical protein
MFKIANTEMLIALNEEVLKNPHANRALDEGAYEKLDPNGWHVFDSSHIVWRMAGHGFVRPMLSIKIKGRDKPVTGNTMDLTQEQWDALPTYTKELDAMLEHVAECGECNRVRPFYAEDYICMDCREKANA